MTLKFSDPVFENVNSPFLDSHHVKMDVLRLDQIHPLINGNKWYKLKLNIAQAEKLGYRTLLSFGGVFSNHLYALAAAGAELGFSTIGVIRGEIPAASNPVLRFAADKGMTLYPISRTLYRNKTSEECRQLLQKRFGPYYVIPEGGANQLGAQGCMDIAEHFNDGLGSSYDAALLACGTGTTMAGLVAGLYTKHKASMPEVIGIPVLKALPSIKLEIEALLPCLLDAEQGLCSENIPYSLESGYHFGGYAKVKQELMTFIEGFSRHTGLPIEPVYTGKLFYAVNDLILTGRIASGSRIAVIHSGGVREDNLNSLYKTAR